MNILDALNHLDPENDDHWTAQGLPRMDVIGQVLQRTVTRQELNDVAASFNRDIARASEAGNATGASASSFDPASVPAEDASLGGDDGAGELQGEGDAAVDTSPSPLFTDDEVLAMPRFQLLKDRDLMERAIALINVRIEAAVKKRNAAQVEVDLWSKHNEILDMLKAHAMPDNRAQENQDAIQAVLRRNQESRIERHKRASAFIAAGTSPKEVASMLRTGSPLDQAMARKGGYGGARPSYPSPVQPQAVGA